MSVPPSAGSSSAANLAVKVNGKIKQYAGADPQANGNTDESATDAALWKKVAKSLDALEGAYRVFGVANVIGSFNGGKEAVLVLYLMLVALVNFVQKIDSTEIKNQLQLAYFKKSNEFPEITSFIAKTMETYADVSTLETYAGSWKDSITACLANQKAKTGASSVCFVMGTRRTDPNAKAETGTFEPCSAWLHPCNFMLCNPVLDWSYHEVWKFMVDLDLDYCSLYAMGYSSIGDPSNTDKNPNLYDSETQTWLPAHKLADATTERGGRK